MSVGVVPVGDAAPIVLDDESDSSEEEDESKKLEDVEGAEETYETGDCIDNVSRHMRTPRHMVDEDSPLNKTSKHSKRLLLLTAETSRIGEDEAIGDHSSVKLRRRRRKRREPIPVKVAPAQIHGIQAVAHSAVVPQNMAAVIPLSHGLLVLEDESSSSDEEDDSELSAIDMADAKQFVWTADGKRTVEVKAAESHNAAAVVDCEEVAEPVFKRMPPPSGEPFGGGSNELLVSEDESSSDEEVNEMWSIDSTVTSKYCMPPPAFAEMIRDEPAPERSEETVDDIEGVIGGLQPAGILPLEPNHSTSTRIPEEYTLRIQPAKRRRPIRMKNGGKLKPATTENNRVSEGPRVDDTLHVSDDNNDEEEDYRQLPRIDPFPFVSERIGFGANVRRPPVPFPAMDFIPEMPSPGILPLEPRLIAARKLQESDRNAHRSDIVDFCGGRRVARRLVDEDNKEDIKDEKEEEVGIMQPRPTWKIYLLRRRQWVPIEPREEQLRLEAQFQQWLAAGRENPDVEYIMFSCRWSTARVRLSSMSSMERVLIGASDVLPQNVRFNVQKWDDIKGCFLESSQHIGRYTS